MLVARVSVIDEARSGDRRALPEEATVLRHEGRSWGVAVLNLSASGCLIRSGEDLSQGMLVRIGLPGVGAFLATVVRASNDEFGCEFETGLTSTQVETAFRTDVVVKGRWDIGVRDALPAELAPMSMRRRLAVIGGVSVVLWLAIGSIGLILLS